MGGRGTRERRSVVRVCYYIIKYIQENLSRVRRRNMLEGIIIKGISGFYYVEVGDEIYECKARGLFRKKKITQIGRAHV